MNLQVYRRAVTGLFKSEPSSSPCTADILLTVTISSTSRQPQGFSQIYMGLRIVPNIRI